MPRPAGHKLNRVAWEDVLRLTGQTMTSVAELAEVPRATLSGLLGQHHGASNPMATRIATALGVHPGTLFPTMATVEMAAV
jgi:plasmid maintenance system antidote protein VapI